MTAASPNPSDDTRGNRCPACPRCGYDQRGVVSTWTDTCPLDGVCSECGLTFAWDEVLRPDRLTPKWSIEFTPRRRGLPWATMHTLLRSLWPWGFWKRMKMAFTIKWLRIVAYLVILFAPLLVGYVAAQSAIAITVLARYQQHFNAQQQQVPAMIARVKTVKMRPHFRGVGLPSMRIAEAAETEFQREQWLQRLQQELLTPSRIEYSYAAAVFDAVFTPLSQESSGKFVYPIVNPNGGAMSMDSVPFPIPPADLWSAVIAPPGAMAGGWGRNIWSEVSPALSAVLFWTVMLLAPFPLSLALLPVTRRRAKVRWTHIARVFAYSLAIPIVASELILLAWLVATLVWKSASFQEEMLVFPVAIGLPAVTQCWWGAAIRNYLRLPHAAAVTIIMSILCVLFVGGTVFWIGDAIWG